MKPFADGFMSFDDIPGESVEFIDVTCPYCEAEHKISAEQILIHSDVFLCTCNHVVKVPILTEGR